MISVGSTCCKNFIYFKVIGCGNEIVNYIKIEDNFLLYLCISINLLRMLKLCQAMVKVTSRAVLDTNLVER